MSARVLLIDNYDSFTYNLAHGLAEQGAEVDVVRHDEVTADEASARHPTHLVISPGPGRPSETGISAELITRLHGSVPILGVCLGHQLLAEMHGGTVTHARRLVHGKAGTVEVVADDPLFAGLGERFEAGRYHSLAATTIPDVLEVSATCVEGEVMAVRHRELPVDGVQFHPESVLTPLGPELARNFLERAR
jgi:anthranilate synthase/aminodeoxychorismate synthase-like glutamine amidotransferase